MGKLDLYKTRQGMETAEKLAEASNDRRSGGWRRIDSLNTQHSG